MSVSIDFERIAIGNITGFVCKDGGWQVTKEQGIHKCSPARDYFVKWVEQKGKWSLYIKSYYELHDPQEIIITVDTLFDVLDYISQNKHTHY